MTTRSMRYLAAILLILMTVSVLLSGCGRKEVSVKDVATQNYINTAHFGMSYMGEDCSYAANYNTLGDIVMINDGGNEETIYEYPDQSFISLIGMIDKYLYFKDHEEVIYRVDTEDKGHECEIVTKSNLEKKYIKSMLDKEPDKEYVEKYNGELPVAAMDTAEPFDSNAVIIDEEIYCAHLDGFIVKYDMDGMPLAIYDDASVTSNLTSDGKNVYFMQDDSYCTIRGEKTVKIAETELIYTRCLFFSNGKLLLLGEEKDEILEEKDSFAVESVAADGSERSLIKDVDLSCTIFDGSGYYMKRKEQLSGPVQEKDYVFDLYKIDLNTEKTEKVFEHDFLTDDIKKQEFRESDDPVDELMRRLPHVDTFYFINDKMYTLINLSGDFPEGNYELFKMNHDGTDPERLYYIELEDF